MSELRRIAWSIKQYYAFILSNLNNKSTFMSPEIVQYKNKFLSLILLFHFRYERFKIILK